MSDLERGTAVRLTTPFSVLDTFEDQYGEKIVLVHAGGSTVSVPIDQVEVLD